MPYLSSGTFWAQTPEEAEKVARACLRSLDRGDAIGLDTEFYGTDVRKQSTFARARLHLLSVAVKRFPAVVLPRGNFLADPAVVTREALPYLRDVFSHAGPKAVHNLGVDQHTLANEGYELINGVNTLAMARWAYPHRARGSGFTLDSLGIDLLGAGKTTSFSELFSEEVTEFRSTWRKTEVCECGKRACGRRRTTEGHSRKEELVETVHERKVQRPVPLETVVHGHKLWDRAVEYSAVDAVLALGVYDLALNQMGRTTREYCW